MKLVSSSPYSQNSYIRPHRRQAEFRPHFHTRLTQAYLSAIIPRTNILANLSVSSRSYQEYSVRSCPRVLHARPMSNVIYHSINIRLIIQIITPLVWLIFLLRIGESRRLAILSFRGFPQYIQSNAGIVP
jgi:hypothetical protein